MEKTEVLNYIFDTLYYFYLAHLQKKKRKASVIKVFIVNNIVCTDVRSI